MERYEKGDSVRILNKHGGHGFYIGEVVTIMRHSHNNSYFATNGFTSWYISSNQVESMRVKYVKLKIL